MKKIFSKEIFLVITPLLLVSLFIFPNIVKADTINIIFSDSDFTVLNETFYSLRQTAISYCETNNCKYSIVYYPNSRYEISYIDNGVSPTTSLGGNLWYVAYTYGSPQFTVCSYNLSGVQTSCSSNAWAVGQKLARTENYTITISQYIVLDTNFIYSNIQVNTQNTYIFTYNNYSFTVSPTDTYIPGYYEVYTRGNQVIDPYPLLTSFFTITLEKLSVITEFISSNYLYLTPFVIFIIYFVILMFRRLK